ncbi:unnamed protein product [Caenorhabditis brenneri]
MEPIDSGVTIITEPTIMSTASYCVKLGATLNQGEDIPPANSPATSVSSMQSEQSDVFRNSPYLAQSPLSSSSLFQRPDFCSADGGDRPMSYPSVSSFSTNLPDSECSSRSSMDGYNLKDTTSEKIKRFRDRQAVSPNVSSSDDEDSVESNESDSVTRKLSSKSSEDKFTPRGIDAPRGRIANIRRESSCSVDSEAAHERLLKASQAVSNGFDDIAIEQERPASSEFRRRAPSFNAIMGEPISVVTNAFITNSCSPSPTRPTTESIKQCYSPSTQQIIRPNMSYSPSPRPSPAQSPTRHGHKMKFQRAESPICRPTKRKMTLTTVGELDVKRSFIPRSNTSPLVTDKTFPYPTFSQLFESTPTIGEFHSFSVPHSPGPLRSTTPMSSISGDQEDNSLSVKDAEEKIFDVEDDMENNGVVSCLDEDDMPPVEDMDDITDNDTTANDELLRAATEASLPDDDDELLDFDD